MIDKTNNQLVVFSGFKQNISSFSNDKTPSSKGTYRIFSLISKTTDFVKKISFIALHCLKATCNSIRGGIKNITSFPSKVTPFCEAMVYSGEGNVIKLQSVFAKNPSLAGNRVLLMTALVKETRKENPLPALTTIVQTVLTLENEKMKEDLYNSLNWLLYINIYWLPSIKETKKIAEALLLLKYNLDAPIRKGYSAIEWAILSKEPEMVSTLINLGCSLDIIGPKGSLLNLAYDLKKSCPKEKSELRQIIKLLKREKAFRKSEEKINAEDDVEDEKSKLHLQLEKLLGKEFSSLKELNAIYRKWMLKNHPDKLSIKDSDSAAKHIPQQAVVQQINELRDEVLNDYGWKK